MTGRSFNMNTGGDFATVAYSAATGAQLWVKRYNGPGNGPRDDANAVAVSPDGARVFVTGSSWTTEKSLSTDYATVAYRASDGRQLWVKRYNGPGNGSDDAYSVASPGNGKVYVTGTSWGGSAVRNDYATIAYNVFTGAQQWVRRYNGPANSGDYGASVTAGSGRVFVTGGSYGINTGLDYAVIAYNG